MKITGNGDEIAKYVNETSLRQSKEATQKATTREDVSQKAGGDTGAVVNISETSKEAQKVKEVIESEPDVRSDKVEATKSRIEQGTYEIDYDKTAEKLLKTFLEEMM